MKKKLILVLTSFIMASFLSLPHFQVIALDNSYGKDVPELLELYESYYDTDYEALYFEETTQEYSSYCAIKEMADIGIISFYGDSDAIIDVNELQQISGYSEDELNLRCGYNKRNEYWSLRMTFSTHDHNSNYESALKITKAIDKTHDIKYAYINVGEKNIIRNNRTCWDRIHRIDEYGIDSSITEELTVKQITDLNSEIAKNGYNATIDKENGNVVFADDVTEKEKFEFAEWLKVNYGFYAFTYSAALTEGILPGERRELYYTDIEGDVNNDGEFNISDLVMLQNFILGNGTLNNWINADLCNDECINVFDMVLLRKKLINSYY